ncbi:MAG: hypothetical protein U0229_21175 [Anaeromyxobacter sp.]
MKRALICGLAVSLLVSCGGGGGAGDQQPSPTGNEAHNKMLQELGINTDVGLRTNAGGQAVPTTYHPTLRGRTTLMKRDELFVAGVRTHNADTSIPAPKVHAFYDWPDGATKLVPAALGTEDAWLQMPKAAAAGDVDGDDAGREELVVAYRAPGTAANSYVLMVRFVQKTAAGYAVLHETQVRTFQQADLDQYPDPSQDYMQNFSVATGDLDGNGKKETVVTFDGWVFLLGDASRSYALLKSIPHVVASDTAYRFLRAAAGDVDNDGRDEVVIVESAILKSNWWRGTASYQILEGTELTEVEHGALAVTDPTLAQTKTLRCANVAVGDVDGDGLNEVVFGGMQENEQIYYLFVLDTFWDQDAKALAHALAPKWAQVPARAGRDLAPPIFVADFDGASDQGTFRKHNEVVLLNAMFDVRATPKAGGLSWSMTNRGLDLWHPSPLGNLPNAWLGYAYDSNGVVGDVDGDGKADLLFVTDSWYEVYWLGFNTAGQWTGKGHVDIWDSGAYYPVVAVGDFDGDSLGVKFVGSETLFTDPHPIALLAASPFWTGVDMSGETSIGYLKGSSTESSSSMGYSLGFSVSYESEGIFDLWDVSIKASFESKFDWTATESRTITETHTWRAYQEDTVFFTAIPYDVYYYEVVSSTDPQKVGKLLTVNLPRQPVINSIDVATYNAKNGDAPDLGPEVLGGSTAGDPFTYPTSAEASALMASAPHGQSMKSTYMEDVGGGATARDIEMSIENTKGTGTKFELEAKVEAEAGAGGVKLGVSAGFQYGEEYKVSSTDGTIFGGSVGGLPTGSNVPSKQFKWGLFTYEAQLGAAPPFVVVQFYVERP